MSTVKHPIRPHKFEGTVKYRGKRKIITYRCRARGCTEIGTISCSPYSAADGAFQILRLAHDDMEEPADLGAVAADIARNFESAEGETPL